MVPKKYVITMHAHYSCSALMLSTVYPLISSLRRRSRLSGKLQLTSISAEIRNRIYHFAKERTFYADCSEPPLLMNIKHTVKLPLPYGGRQFFDHDEEDYEDILLGLTLLSRLRDFCPTFVARFRPCMLIEGDFLDVDCEECGHSINCGCDSGCDHEDALDEVIDEIHWRYDYTHALDEILANSNASWLMVLRKDAKEALKVECTIDLEAGRATVYIRYRMGMALALLAKENIYRATGKYVRHCMAREPIYNQVEVGGDTVTVPKKDTGSAAKM
ncbi:hypothetical protein CC86DRAFT_396625 [Ophiobolus disseminans]|uniref:Uncharacterized protein n=1 Tax=Ophiobolus disseminans TaxID=1469910 RepID=A0A6A6ZNB5_9PLEO|nr:hypothetical protein CC86DRAFT_396625 [Ophiobolus disseminans]